MMDLDLIALTSQAELIGRDKNGLLLSISKKHITHQSDNWIEIHIKNDSELGQKLKRN